MLKFVAAMDTPASHQGRLRPDRKKSPMERLALRVKSRPAKSEMPR